MAEKTTKASGVAEAVRRARAKARRVVSRGKAAPEENPKAEQEEPVTMAAPTRVIPEASKEAPPKRKPGRPKGSKNKPESKPEEKAEIKAVPPRRRVRPSKEVQAEKSEAPPKRKPGRPKGSKNKTQAQKAAEERAKRIARAAKAGKKAAQRRKGRGKAQAERATEKVRKAKEGPRKPPTTGQSAPPIALRLRQLNAKEQDVLNRLNGTGTGTREVCTIASLAVDCFGNFPPKQANSWVRNSLRRLMQGQLIEKVDRGSYRVSELGRRKLTKAA